MERRKRSAKSAGVRIIGGRWRGRRLPSPAGRGIRPTGDRIRETLFNWLAPWLDGARCLDLFAGTGALGLEALSRGAGGVVFVEADRAAAAQLTDMLRTLDCRHADVINADACVYLGGTPTRFDIVFIDPPFGSIDLGNLCTLIERDWIGEGGLVYLELSRRDSCPALPPGWSIVRDKTAGQVRFMLMRRTETDADVATGD